jgi:phosphoribosylformimino-5-aminoimidazole carboxamide ribotide isomerase
LPSVIIVIMNYCVMIQVDAERQAVDIMEVIPAIDLRMGRCVRLYQGDYGKETVFSEDPVTTALNWQSLGAHRIHIVDLDGAALGEVQNIQTIKEIAHAVLIPTELGGGMRSLEAIEQVLKAGVERIILGTVAVEMPELVQEVCRRYSESVIVSIDARDGLIATRGWQIDTKMEALEFARSMVKLGVQRFVYTDISRDGTLTEPNFTAIMEMIEALRLPVIAAGGISSLTHLKILKLLGVEGAIVGRALYTGDINLKKALEIFE